MYLLYVHTHTCNNALHVKGLCAFVCVTESVSKMGSSSASLFVMSVGTSMSLAWGWVTHGGRCVQEGRAQLCGPRSRGLPIRRGPRDQSISQGCPLDGHLSQPQLSPSLCCEQLPSEGAAWGVDGGEQLFPAPNMLVETINWKRQLIPKGKHF